MRTVGWRTVLLVLAPFAACALVYLPTLSGALLSDDYAVLAAVSDWSREGHLLRALLSKFHSGLDSPSFYYRPLSMASFGANFALSGADPLGWRLTNLALHLISGALVFAIARRFSLEDGSEPSNIGPAIAAAVFLLFPHQSRSGCMGFGALRSSRAAVHAGHARFFSAGNAKVRPLGRRGAFDRGVRIGEQGIGRIVAGFGLGRRHRAPRSEIAGSGDKYFSHFHPGRT